MVEFELTHPPIPNDAGEIASRTFGLTIQTGAGATLSLSQENNR